jgi:archaemetzincin
MGVNNKSRRRQFPGTEVPEDSDLQTEPLPLESEDLGLDLGPGEHAPIVLIPIGVLDDGLLERLRAPLEDAFKRPALLLKALPPPKYAFNPTRGQYHSAAILKRVEALRASEWDAALGIVDADLFVPEVPFIFGEADRSTRSAIISLSRLRSEGGTQDSKRDLLGKRLLAECIHQMGLIRGLAQCPNNRCVMFFSATVQDTDKKGAAFCANCRKRLLSEA